MDFSVLVTRGTRAIGAFLSRITIESRCRAHKRKGIRKERASEGGRKKRGPISLSISLLSCVGVFLRLRRQQSWIIENERRGALVECQLSSTHRRYQLRCKKRSDGREFSDVYRSCVYARVCVCCCVCICCVRAFKCFSLGLARCKTAVARRYGEVA